MLREVWVPTDDHRIIIIIMKIEEKGLVDAPALNFCRAQQPADRRAIVGGARRAHEYQAQIIECGIQQPTL